VDDYLVDFSMKLARDGAWKFALSIADRRDAELQRLIEERDKKVSGIVNVILNPGLLALMVLKIIRITERGSVKEKLQKLKIQRKEAGAKK
jgi:hypothetical protein